MCSVPTSVFPFPLSRLLSFFLSPFPHVFLLFPSIYIYMCMYVHIYMCVCTVSTSTSIYVYMCVSIYVSIYLSMYLSMHIHVYMYCTYIYMYIYIYIYIPPLNFLRCFVRRDEEFQKRLRSLDATPVGSGPSQKRGNPTRRKTKKRRRETDVTNSVLWHKDEAGIAHRRDPRATDWCCRESQHVIAHCYRSHDAKHAVAAL